LRSEYQVNSIVVFSAELVMRDKDRTVEAGSTIAAGESLVPVLYVDDEPDNLKLFRLQFEREFPELVTVSSAAEALRLLEGEQVGVLATDERMPGMSGTELLGEVAARWPDVGRIIISAYSDSMRLLGAINRGHAQEYVLKPWQRGELLDCLRRCLVTAQRRRELCAKALLADALTRDIGRDRGARRLIGIEGGLRAVCQLARRAAQTSATVLILGETGTGKELLARFLHDESPRAGKPFIALNCAALPESLLESELFGHEQGAFTGALRARKGRFELAQGGTLFLDEIGDISPRLQLTLLRVLQEKKIERLGASQSISVDARVVAATHRNLERLVAEGTFREDLFYRLNVIPLHVPPLRERRQDLPALVQHFMDKWAHAADFQAPRVLANDVLPSLAAYGWPGNVRELENIVQRALILSDSAELGIDDFSVTFSAVAPKNGSVRTELQELESERLRRLLMEHGGNCTRAAKALQIPRTTLISRAKKHGLI
jgi:DNA-binding NtrC family response regulator